MKNGFWLMILALYAGLSGLVQAVNEPIKATGSYIHGDTEQKISYIEGNVRITQDATQITTDRAIIFMEKKQAIFENNVVLNNPDGTVNADYLDYDLRKKIGVFKGNVVMQRKAVAKDAKAKKAAKDPFTLRAEELYLESDKQNFVATNSKFEHKEFTGSANQITYDDTTEEMLFKGNVHLRKGKGEEIRGEETKINLKDKSFMATNNVSIEIEVDESNDDSDSRKNPGKDSRNKERKNKK